MRIVIDMQGAQAESRFCGNGLYTLSLAQAIVSNRGGHEFILALSGLFPDTIEPIRAAFDSMLSQENIRVWYAPGPVRECESGNDWRREVAELIREAFIASLRPDVVFVPNFLAGYQDDGVTSIGLFAKELVTVVAVSQLNAVQTGMDSQRENIHTLRKLEHLKRADALIALPPLTIDEVSRVLGVSQERVKAYLSACNFETEFKNISTEAESLIRIFDDLVSSGPKAHLTPSSFKPKLAVVSPFPPEKSGIADYSAELLPELARFYDIDVIVAQKKITTPWLVVNCGVQTIDGFLQNAHRYSRVLYHFGNSPYHQYMFDLLVQVPGVVVLHDFYLGDVNYYRESHALLPYAWTCALYNSHGYGALTERFRVENEVDVVRKYPANFEVVQRATGVIVHSEYSRSLAGEWYEKEIAADWKVIPLLRASCTKFDRVEYRTTLGLKPDDFVVCSFGMLGPGKLNHRLLNAWLASDLAKNTNCILVFVGENHGGEYGAELLNTIQRSGLGKRIRITGWTDTATFRDYLAAADMGVQLRTFSRGETSAAVLDCMNFSLPTIVNANGSMAELPTDAVCMLPDEFEDRELVDALENLWKNDERRSELGRRAQEVIMTRHAPRACAEQYAAAIEQFHARSQNDAHSLVKAIADLEGYLPTDSECGTLAGSIAYTLPITKPTRQLFIDVSAIFRNDLKTGIQRVVRALLKELLQTPPSGYRIEPVYLADLGHKWHYRYAREWTSGALGIQGDWMSDEAIEYCTGDIMLVADFTGGLAVEAERSGVFAQLKNNSVKLCFIVYDLLPIQMPDVFPPGQFGFVEWINAVNRVADGVICISSAVAEEFRLWAEISGSQRLKPFKIDWFHLGADVESSAPTRGLPKNARQILTRINARPSFLMVGTIEPRKGYMQTLEAFTELWKNGSDTNLIIVGGEGWKSLPDDMRRTIPEITNRLRNHPELNKRLYWLEGVSDEYLEKIYASSTCLISASEGEGFGLPLIEAAQHGLPIIARDIPVFREVAGDYAFYFSGLESGDLADAIKQWLLLNAEGKAPQSDTMPYLTWRESAVQLVSRLLQEEEVGDSQAAIYSGHHFDV